MVLAEMMALVLEDAGYIVERQFKLGSTAVVHQVLVNDAIDIYVDYTGLLAILGMELPESSGDTATSVVGAIPVVTSGQDEVYQIVKEQYQEQFGFTWLQ